jgi:GntR family transcriptional regulator / MocR family aminotransferase
MRIPIDLDRSLAQPLADQLAERLRGLLREGEIRPGARLPSSRALADQLGVARNTVVRAYETLAIEGVVESRVASGFYAAERADGVLEKARGGTKPRDPTLASMPVPATLAAPERSPTGSKGLLHDFVPARPNPELFPLKTWRRLLQGCLAYGASSGLAEYGDPGGLTALRAAVAAHLALGRGIAADPAQILILNGSSEGLSLLARVFSGPGTRVLLENPCYEGAVHALASGGATLGAVPVDEDGLDVDALPEEPASLLYITPGHQYPTGATLSEARRERLIAWARRQGCYLVEDDYDCEFRYDGSPLPALAGRAPDCTIYLGTFSTTLGAGLRLGYAVVPPRLIDAMRAAKALASRGNSWVDQAVLAKLMQSGSYAAHLTRCRAAYAESRDALVSALRRHFGAVELSGEGAGLHLFVRIPAGVPEASRLEGLARAQGVGIYSLRSAGAHELVPTPYGTRGILLGYAGLTPKQIEQGILRLSDAVDDTLDSFPDFVGELLVDEQRRARPLRPVRSTKRRSEALRQPAIRTISRHSAAHARQNEERFPMRIVRGIYRYPIKGLSPQPLRGVDLEAGKPFPFDRVFALARPNVGIDRETPRWAKKGMFLMLMLDETLAEIDTFVDARTLELTVHRSRAHTPPGARPELLLQVDLKRSEGRAATEAFFRRQVTRLTEDPLLVHAPNAHFMDKPDNVMSCINLATLRELEKEWQTSLHPLRFRANFYIEGLRAWEEFEWIGSDIELGDVLFRVDRRNGRCSATNVNPVTGARDLDIPGELRKRYGHKDLGVYLVAQTSGKVVIGDQVTVPELPTAATPSQPFVVPRAGTFICRGCYYVYVESRGTADVPAGTPFGAIPESFACPDCGTGKASFRPYLADLGADASDGVGPLPGGTAPPDGQSGWSSSETDVSADSPPPWSRT